jgi:hypothetical protein
MCCYTGRLKRIFRKDSVTCEFVGRLIFKKPAGGIAVVASSICELKHGAIVAENTKGRSGLGVSWFCNATKKQCKWSVGGFASELICLAVLFSGCFLFEKPANRRQAFENF